MKFLILLVLVALPIACMGIKCLECAYAPESSNLDHKECPDGDEKYSVECTKLTPWPTINPKETLSSLPESSKQTAFSCIEASGTISGYNAVVRGCWAKSNDESGSGTLGPFSGNYRICNSDNCNSSHRGTAYPIVVLMSTFIISIQYFGK